MMVCYQQKINFKHSFTCTYSVAMTPINEHLYVVKNMFPGQVDRIEELFNMSEDFRSLCADYMLCLRYLERFKRESVDKKTSISEYTDVTSDLEQELSRFIFPA